MSTAASAGIAIDVPQRLPAWGTASVKVVVHNTTGKPIVPLAIELASDVGTLGAWGVDATCRGTHRSCSIELRWAFATPARRRGTTWELLLGGPPPQQMMSAPDALSQAATEQLLKLDPIPAGETVELEVPFVAMYQHGGRLTATLTYASLDPTAIVLCTAASPTQKAFVACTPATTLGGTMYADHTELARVQQRVQANATFTIDHPTFDIADARAKAKVPTGEFGYERATERWLLVDGQRTVAIGADGKRDDLPGDWLDQLVTLDGMGSTTTYWNGTEADASAIAKRLGADQLSWKPFGFKGKTSSDRFVVTFKRDEVTRLAAAMRALGYRMTDSGIRK